MIRSSIRGRLLVLLFLSITAVWGIAVFWSYRQTEHEVREWDNAKFTQLAMLLAQLDERDLAQVVGSGIDVRNEYSRHAEHFPESDGDKLPRRAFIEVKASDGRIIAQSKTFSSLALHAPRDVAPGAFATFDHDGSTWLVFELPGSPTGRTVRVITAALTHSDLVSGVAGHVARPMLFALPLLAILVWVSIGRSLAPLASLSKAVSSRDATRLDPIIIEPGPIEVRPLVNAINELLERLQASFAWERAFTSDAAHELKTPLAAIKVQAQVALLAEDGGQLRLAMERVIQGVDRSAHLAEQLLLLARLDEQQKIKTRDVDVCLIAKEAIASRELDLLTNSMIADFSGPSHGLARADAILLRILIDNLLDNSIKYCQPGGRIDVRVHHTVDWLKLSIADDGPGVTSAETERLTRRFFRGSNVTACGSGLGLSIVARIASCFDAALNFDSGINGLGLAVVVTFNRLEMEVALAGRHCEAIKHNEEQESPGRAMAS